MLESVIYRYLTHTGEEMMSIGSYGYMRTELKTAKQLISMIAIRQTNEQREYVTSLSKQELYNQLTCFKQKHAIKVLYPN